MKPDITQELIVQLVEIIRSSKAFIVSEAPGVIREIYSWGIWSNTIGLRVGIGLIILGVILFGLLYVECADGFEPPIAIVGVLALIIGTIVSIGSYLDLQKIKTAPKLYLLDYLKGKSR